MFAPPPIKVEVHRLVQVHMAATFPRLLFSNLHTKATLSTETATATSKNLIKAVAVGISHQAANRILKYITINLR